MGADNAIAWVIGAVAAAGLGAAFLWSLLRKRRELPEPTRRPGQDVVEAIVLAYMRDVIGHRFTPPRTIWDAGENKMVGPTLIKCTSWEGYVHECLHAARAQMGVLDPWHAMREDWGTIVGGRWQFDRGHNVEMQRLVREAGFVP